MKKRKIVLIIVSLLIVTLGAIIIVHISLKSRNKKDNTDKPDVSIKSTLFSPIEKGNIKIENVDIYSEGENVSVNLTLKNLKDKDIHGYHIVLELLNKEKEVVKSIQIDSLNTIPAKDKATCRWGTTIEGNVDEIKSARIAEVEANTDEELHTVVELND